MSPALAIKIGGVLVLVLAFAVMWRRTGREMKVRKQTFLDRGASWSLGLGTCLSGLPGLEQPALVTCGGTATELIFLADDDNRELCRIPWSAISNIFGGNEEETHRHLNGTDAPPSLILAQSDHSLDGGKHHYVPSYTVIDWTDGASRRRQAVFEPPGGEPGLFQDHLPECHQDGPRARRFTPGWPGLSRPGSATGPQAFCR